MKIQYGKQYRIMKKYRRVGEFEEVDHYFEVQYLGYTFSLLFFPRKLKWKPCKRTVWNGWDVYNENVTYDKLEDAERYVAGVLSPVYADEIVKGYQAISADFDETGYKRKSKGVKIEKQ